MEQLPPLGTAIAAVMQPTMDIYRKLLLANAKAIKATARRTYKYGPSDRHTLDVYTPAKQDSSKPIFIFLHGGGLTGGARVLESDQAPEELVYTNVGHFFAEKYGFTVVIANYRLMRHGAKFPSGGEDVSWVIDWLRSNPKELGSAADVQRSLFAMGVSAGGIHLSTYLFGPMFAEHRKGILSNDSSLRLRGAILVSSPFSTEDLVASRIEMINEYWGSRNTKNSPLELLKTLIEKSDTASVLPGVKFLALKATLDPEDEVFKSFDEFERVWNKGGNARDLQVEWIAGHNHISPAFSLGTGIPVEEAWAQLVGVFVNTTQAFALST